VRDKNTGRVLGTVGIASYPVDHKNIAEAVFNEIADANLDNNIKVTHYLSRDGIRYKCSILLKDYVMEPKVGDPAGLVLVFETALTAVKAYRDHCEWLRYWCANGCASIDHHLSTRAKHTKNFDIDFLAGRFVNAPSYYMEDEEKFKKMIETSIERPEVEELFSKTIANSPQRGKPDNVNQKLLTTLMGNYDDEARQQGESLWSVYNAMTNWYTHHPMKKDADFISTNSRRRNDVIKVMESDNWKRLAA